MEDIKGGLKEPHELGLEIQEMRHAVHQFQLKFQEVNKQLEKMKNQEKRKEEEQLQVNQDLRRNNETIKEMETREMSLQHTMEKLMQGIL